MSARQRSVLRLNERETVGPQRVEKEQGGGALKSQVARDPLQLGAIGWVSHPNPGSMGSSVPKGLAAVLAQKSRPRGAEAERDELSW